jgi:hypothetical protein
MRNFRENLRTKANYDIKNIFFVSALSIYLERIDAFLFHELLELVPVLRHLQVVSPLPGQTRKKIDDNQSIDILSSNLVEVSLR